MSTTVGDRARRGGEGGGGENLSVMLEKGWGAEVGEEDGGRGCCHEKGLYIEEEDERGRGWGCMISASSATMRMIIIAARGRLAIQTAAAETGWAPYLHAAI